jgi:hypothetical protein
MEANTSTTDSIPSAIKAKEFPKIPATNLIIAKAMFPSMLKMTVLTARLLLFMGGFNSEEAKSKEIEKVQERKRFYS